MDKYDVYTAVHNGLKAMFFCVPRIEIVGDSVEFSLYGSEAKMVTLATMKRWMKQSGIDAYCKRERVLGWSGYTGTVEYRITAKD